MKLTTGFNNGVFTDISKINVPVDSIGVNRSYGVFDFFRVINKKTFYLDRHLNRFFNSITLLKLQLSYTCEDLKSLIEEVIKKNNSDNFFIKLFAIPLNNESQKNLNSGLFIVPLQGESYNGEVYDKGANLITKEYTRFLPEVKSTNYLPMVYWHTEINQNQAVDVLYHNSKIIHETSRGNIFIVKDDTVFTPSKNILKGITRSVVIDIIKEKNISFIEQPVTLKQLFEADEVFLTSTTKKVLPVVKIDSNTIGNGKVGKKTKNLMRYFDAIQANWPESKSITEKDILIKNSKT